MMFPSVKVCIKYITLHYYVCVIMKILYMSDKDRFTTDKSLWTADQLEEEVSSYFAQHLLYQ